MKNKIDILIIDDDYSFFALFKEKIEELKFENAKIIVTYSNNENIENFTDKDIDIFIVDNFFNGKEKSIEIIDKIKSIYENSYIYIATGYGNYKLLKEIINKDVTGFIDKNDITFDKLTESIKTIANDKETLSHIKEKLSFL